MTLGELRTGTDQIRKTAEGSKGKGRVSSYISWKPDEVKTVHFVTPLEEVPKILLHQFVRKLVEDENGDKQERWLTLMCRKDPAWTEESSGECPLCDDIGHAASEKFISLAVEVEQVMDGKRPKGVKVKMREGKDRDGKKADYPQVGLVIQGSKNFFNILVAHGAKREISDISWEITREGERLDTTYMFYPIEFMPDLEKIKDFIPNLNDILDNMGSSETYERELEGVTAEDQPSFPGRDSKKPSKKTSNTIFENLKDELKTY